MLTSFLFRVCVLFDKPVVISEPDGESTVIGYYRVFGLTAASEAEAKQLCVSEASRDEHSGKIDWADTVTGTFDPEDGPAEITSSWKPNVPGVWYRSGRAFFPSGD